jgi:hypothetical protein
MINIEQQQIIDYLEQSIILNLYQKDAISKFRFNLNNAITDAYTDFNPDYLEVVKPKPFFIDQASLEELQELYKTTAINVCQKFGLNFVENPSNNYIPKENDYLLVTYKYDPVPKDITTNIPLQLKMLDEITKHSLSLADPFEKAVGGVILFFNIEKKPSMHRSLINLFKENKYASISTENVLFGISSEQSFNSIKNNIKPDLLKLITPINVIDLKPNHTKKLKLG